MLSLPVSLIITLLILLLIALISYLLIKKLPKALNSMGSEITEEQPTSANFTDNNNNYNQQSMPVMSQVDPNKKLTKKEQIKMLKKQEKAEAREQQRQMMEAKKLKELQKEKEMQLKEKQKEEERQKLEEELKKVKEEQEKKENDIYNQWKDMIKVGEEGEDRMDFTNESVINEFLNYIKIRKVVSLEDLTGVFKLNPNELVDKLNLFEKQGRILGIIDDRGKYIYITEKEMSMIEKMFLTRGRITKSDLIKECNRIIKFEPSEEDKIKIKEEQKKMLEKLENEINVK